MAAVLVTGLRGEPGNFDAVNQTYTVGANAVMFDDQGNQRADFDSVGANDIPWGASPSEVNGLFVDAAIQAATDRGLTLHKKDVYVYVLLGRQ